MARLVYDRGNHLVDSRELPALVWRFDEARLVVSSAPLGGGIGPRSWIVNAQVPLDYHRTDVEAHLAEIAAANGCSGAAAGVGMLTAAAVDQVGHSSDDDVHAFATVGLTKPTWAADADGAVSREPAIGTINIVVLTPHRCSDAALVNMATTATEAKTQALLEAGTPGTGTASDAVCIACPSDGTAETFGGPRSRVGAPAARAVHAAVRIGIEHLRSAR